LMEIGALVCTARVKKCGECPVRRGCRSSEV
jgi:adenine-specific DNA glycosylase